MKVQMLKILLLLCGSLSLGICNGMHLFSGSFDYSDYTSTDNPEFENDICFDGLVHSMQMDMEGIDYTFDILLTERPTAWLTADKKTPSCGQIVCLPLRAPPSVG